MHPQYNSSAAVKLVSTVICTYASFKAVYATENSTPTNTTSTDTTHTPKLLPRHPSQSTDCQIMAGAEPLNEEGSPLTLRSSKSS